MLPQGPISNDIQSSAGQQAEIIVAGYPKLLDKEGKGVLISEKEATIVNSNVTKFNNAILDIVNECRNEGMNIHFVDVETEFDKDGGHQAYSDNAWINKIILTKQDQDLDQSGIASAYSIHPNEEGAKAYARCVNAMIREIENEKQARLLSAAAAAAQSEVIGSVADASDENAVPENAVINVYSGDELILTVPADAEGNYSFALADGEYTVEISAEGYALSEVPLVIAGGDTAMDTVFLTAEQV